MPHRKLIAMLFLLLVGMPLFSGAQDCPQIPAVPTPNADDLNFHDNWQSVAEPYMARYAVSSGHEANYGVGYLDVTNIDDYYYDWPRHVVLPLWSAPDNNAFDGWLHSGRVYRQADTAPFALSGVGLVETEYESSRFIVDDTADQGWVRFKLKPGANGKAWTHVCHLAIGKAKLAYKEWTAFLTDHRDWLHFREQVPHNLRGGPGTQHATVTTIGLDHKLVLKQIQGDWMQVTVQQPDTTCTGEREADFKGSTHEGWVKWRDDEIGPWVWVYTRGC